MNPLCCIAPVSLDRERSDSAAVVSTRGSAPPLLEDPSFRCGRSSNSSVNGSSKHGGGSCHTVNNGGCSENGQDSYRPKETAVSVASTTAVGLSDGAGVDGRNVAGILYKWVNYGKGWRARWFVLEDGVLSYYKIHGPDKISVSAETEKGVRVIGEESVRHMRKQSWGNGVLMKKRKPFGEVHLKVSSIRGSRSDDKRFYIFSGTKTLHLRCESHEDRAYWIEALLSAKDLFPRVVTNGDSSADEITVSTDKLRCRLLQEGLSETSIRDCESILLSELSDLRDKLKSLQQKHYILLDTLRQLETEKVELETTVVDESKERDMGIVNGRLSDFYSILSEGTGTDSEADNESRDGPDGETDEDDGAFFDTKEFWASESLRCSSTRGGEYKNLVDGWYTGFSSDADARVRTINFPYVRRRSKLPEPKEKEKPVGLWSIIKENIGKDLSGVCLPVYFNEPLSSLQKCFEDLEYSYLVDQASEWGKQGNSLMRILSIAAFAVSGYASTEGRQCKPFNPLLGETYEADYPDKGLHFISEKVSHHPMIVACHCEGREWKFWADSNLKGKFWGRSIQLDPIGVLTLQFDDGETFQWSKVTTSIYNIIIGKIYCDHYGTMRIKGSGNYSCKLKFKEQSIIDRNPHQVQGFVQDNRTGQKVAMLVGKWDEAMYYVLGDPSTKPKGYDPMSEAVLLWERDKSIPQTRYNLTPFAISLNELTPGLSEKLPPTDSRLRPDQRHLENGEYEMANAEKLRLEQLQRQARKLQEGGWQPRWFKKDKEDGCYRYVGGYWEARAKRQWDGIPDIFGQAAPSAECPTPVEQGNK
ncbi:oxysterol-binding protein-related protein 1D isoform X1 [Nymphaea colorata]|nr:oxysterol-binding protein-related protein 1D isoform X1 [Nymphaea colorata]